MFEATRSEPNRPDPRMVSVVIPVRDEADRLPGQLEALAAQTYRGDWEVVVADNGSTDASREVAIAHSDRLPSLTVVDASDRAGASHARNVGARRSRGDLLVFCDADDLADPGWLEAIVRSARTADLVGGRLDEEALNDDLVRSWRKKAQPGEGLPLAHFFLPYAVSANVAVWRDVFDETGGWSERYRVSEDVELSFRAQLAGYRLGWAPDAVVAYRYRTSLRGWFRQFFRAGEADAMLYREYRGRGMPRSDVRYAVRTYLWLVWNLARLPRSAYRRGVWMLKAGTHLGRLRGSIRHRVFFP